MLKGLLQQKDKHLAENDVTMKDQEAHIAGITE
jgi:hypothetical protein